MYTNRHDKQNHSELRHVVDRCPKQRHRFCCLSYISVPCHFDSLRHMHQRLIYESVSTTQIFWLQITICPFLSRSVFTTIPFWEENQSFRLFEDVVFSYSTRFHSNKSILVPKSPKNYRNSPSSSFSVYSNLVTSETTYCIIVFQDTQTCQILHDSKDTYCVTSNPIVLIGARGTPVRYST